jgi:hypothetical protein
LAEADAMQKLPRRAVAIVLLLLGLGAQGCLSFGGAYGGPTPRPQLGEELFRALETRDLRLAMDVDCRGWVGSGCWEAGLAIQETLRDLGVLWQEEREPGPTHEIVFLLADAVGDGWWVSAAWNFIGLWTLWTILPMAGPQEDTEIAGILIAPDPSTNTKMATAQLRSVVEKMSESESYLYGKPVVPDAARVIASTYAAHSARYSGSALVPTAWIGGRGERIVSFPGDWLPGPERFRPWQRRALEHTARLVLLRLVHQIPANDADQGAEPLMQLPNPVTNKVWDQLGEEFGR